MARTPGSDLAMAIPSRRDVLTLLDGGRSYEAVAAQLGVPAGLAYLVATGIPSDGSDTYTDEELRRPGALAGSTQHLSNPPHANPRAKPAVREWIRGRAASGLRQVSG